MTFEIPKRDWSDFCDAFSRKHEGWLVSTSVAQPRAASIEIGHDQPLRGLTYDPDREELTVILGPDFDQHLDHIIHRPSAIWVEQTEEGADESLHVQAPAGETTLRFRVAALPEMVDGV
jgi:hypothetical protein